MRRAFAPWSSSLISKRYKSGRRCEGHFYGHKRYDCILYLRPSRSLGSTDGRKGALEEAGRAVQHITEAAPNELELGGA